MTKHFELSWDTTLKVMTAIVILLFVVLGSLPFFTEDIFDLKAFIPVVGMIVLTVIVYLYSPKSYEVSATEIIVNRPIGPRKISRSSVKCVIIPTKEQMKGTWRSLGVGGFFGYYGSFVNKHFGDMTWFVTNRKNIVMVYSSFDKFAFSPNDVAGFLAALEVTE